MREVKARPRAWRQEGRATNGTAAVSGGHAHSSITSQPVALAVAKRGRVCIVAKVTSLDGEPILAVAHRRQHGVDTTISVPVAALDYARRAGCRWLYFRRDTSGEAWRIPLADLPRVGWLGPGAGAEWYLPIPKMEPVAWRRWPYAESVVRLDDPQPRPGGRQLALFGA